MTQANSIYDLLQLNTSSIAIGISLLVAVQATNREKKAKKRTYEAQMNALKAEDIKHLLGEMETVGFTAFKILRIGLPQKSEDLTSIIPAIMNAYLFERSDRAQHCFTT